MWDTYSGVAEMKKFIALAMAGAAMSLTAGAAQAAVSFTASSVSMVYSGSPTVDLHKTNSPSIDWNNVKAGPQTLHGTFSNAPSTVVDLFAYCVDVLQGSGPATFGITSLSSYLSNATKVSQLAALINAEGDTHSKLHDAAVQLAIWEIINETRSTYDLDWMSGYSGQIYFNDFSDGTIKGMAEGFIATAVANAGKPTPGLNLYVAQNADKQDFLYWNRSPVPEPATWGMMLLGLGAVGGAMRSRRATAKVSFS
jgi:hypothetical protein